MGGSVKLRLLVLLAVRSLFSHKAKSVIVGALTMGKERQRDRIANNRQHAQRHPTRQRCFADLRRSGLELLPGNRNSRNGRNCKALVDDHESAA